MSKEAMKLALEALEKCRTYHQQDWSSEETTTPEVKQAIKSLREALAEQPAQQRHISYVCPQCYWSLDEQPAQQEPVAYMVKAHGMLQRLSRRADVADELACQYREDDPNAEVLPLYTSQPAQRKQLTDEQIKEIANNSYSPYHSAVVSFARAIEAAHGIKGDT